MVSIAVLACRNIPGLIHWSHFRYTNLGIKCYNLHNNCIKHWWKCNYNGNNPC